jgi:hypothetical protein
MVPDRRGVADTTLVIMPGGPRRLTLFLAPVTAETVHGLLDAELAQRATQAGLDLAAWGESSDEARELTMTHQLIGGWLASLEQS